MKTDYPKAGIGFLCGLFGKTRQAYYDAQERQADTLLRREVVLQLVTKLRQQQPRLGTRKLHYVLNHHLAAHAIQVGRDELFGWLAQAGMLVRQRRRRAITTDSRHWMRCYSNLIGSVVLERAEQVWVSDITYLRLSNGFAYLSLITDAYSHKIVGYHLQPDLSSQGPLAALQLALAQRTKAHLPLIHHSDRGSQYCCQAYIRLLQTNQVAISMSQRGDPYENAVAERVNGILKSEQGLYQTFPGLAAARLGVEQAVRIYNQERPHGSCNYLTPDQAHQQQGQLPKRWRPSGRALVESR